jgi:hypothetical protein
MAKPAKRSVGIARRTPPSRARAPSPRNGAAPGELREGKVTGIDSAGAVRAVLSGGTGIEALCPAHINARWLTEAARLAPISAVFLIAQPSGRYVLFGLFPSREQAEVRIDLLIRGREVRIEADLLHLGSRNAQLRLDPEGNVTVRGRDVTSHARRVNRIKGGAIRLN